jgi:hypothetical protein
VHAAAAREDDFNLVDENPVTWEPRTGPGRSELDPDGIPAGTRDVYTAWGIERSTLRSTLVSAPREVRVGWQFSEYGGDPYPCSRGVPEPAPYVLFAYAADNRVARAANDKLESRYDPFYVLGGAERLLAETGDTAGTG